MAFGQAEKFQETTKEILIFGRKWWLEYGSLTIFSISRKWR